MIPELLSNRLHTLLQDEYESVISAFSSRRKGSFRINPIQGDESTVLSELREKGILVEPFPEIPGVYQFERSYEYAIKGTQSFYRGLIYLQSLSSLLPAIILSPQKGEKVLDVCSAPGSKTTQMSMMMSNQGKIVALEKNTIRYNKLLYNIRLQGATIIESHKIDAREYLSFSRRYYFDRILLDAPCSAEGRISLSNEKTYNFWSLDNIREKANLQYELLTLAFSSLRLGGTLVYSTCTLAPEENEGVLSRFLAQTPNAILEPIHIGLSHKLWWKSGILRFEDIEYIEDMRKAVRILPSEDTEGFFIAKIRKSA